MAEAFLLFLLRRASETVREACSVLRHIDHCWPKSEENEADESEPYQRLEYAGTFVFQFEPLSARIFLIF